MSKLAHPRARQSLAYFGVTALLAGLRDGPVLVEVTTLALQATYGARASATAPRRSPPKNARAPMLIARGSPSCA